MASRPPLKVSPTATIRSALDLMADNHVGCVLVTDGDQVVGVFTERDALTQVLTAGIGLDAGVQSVMTTDPLTIRSDESVAQCIRIMHHAGIRHLPVCDQEGRVKSVISVRRIVQYLVEHFPDQVYNLPPDPQQKQTAREGA